MIELLALGLAGIMAVMFAAWCFFIRELKRSIEEDF